MTITALEPEGDNLWTVTRPLKILGLTMATRMTVVRLSSGELLLHSPVKFDPQLQSALDEIGTPRHLVAPNRFHHLFLPAYKHAYPEALSYAAPGLAQKRRDFTFDQTLGSEAPAAWRDELDQIIVAGVPMLNEVVFFHRASGTLILTDLAFNVGPNSPFGLRLWARLNLAYGRLQPTALVKTLFRDKTAARASIDHILRLDFERVIMAHGDVARHRAKAHLTAAYRWL